MESIDKNIISNTSFYEVQHWSCYLTDAVARGASKK